MRLNADTLIAIARKLVDLEKIDIAITSFNHHGYTILVETTDTQMEGRTYYMVGVEDDENLIAPPRKGRPIRDNPQAQFGGSVSVCDACKGKPHDGQPANCKGGNWCDCLHRLSIVRTMVEREIIPYSGPIVTAIPLGESNVK